VFASFSNLGDIIVAEPGALIGYAGPCVAERIICKKLPVGSYSAEFLYAHGMADALVDRREQRAFHSRALAIFAARRSGHQRRARSFRQKPDGEGIGPGAYPRVESDERSSAAELAASLARTSTLSTRIVSEVIGEGGSDGALALAVADRVIMLEGTIYSVIAPEEAAAILYRDEGRAPEVSTKLKLPARSQTFRCGR
jgi:hypothetical protein